MHMVYFPQSISLSIGLFWEDVPPPLHSYLVILPFVLLCKASKVSTHSPFMSAMSPKPTRTHIQYQRMDSAIRTVQNAVGSSGGGGGFSTGLGVPIQ